MTTASEQASDRVRRVEAAFDAAIGAWTGVGQSIGAMLGVTPQDQVLGALRQMRRLGLEPWAARRQTIAESDTQGWERWVEDGNDLLHNLATTAQDAKPASIQGIVTATVRETTKDVRTVATTVWRGRWALAAAIVAVAVVVWRLRP